ncbi:protein of unknown function [Legionella hackeliae]|uniref:Uncharacterized protein n=1 Tax=Legionella hackeliae TaxID=449 RepID=A0A0A8URJ7_LEGHA|nr:protein of unknown function [Legionella hackeliae]
MRYLYPLLYSLNTKLKDLDYADNSISCALLVDLNPVIFL